MEDKRSWYMTNNNCPIEKKFGYNDIQKGDKIKRTRMHRDGTHIETTGVAELKDPQAWFSVGGAFLAVEFPSSDWEDTYELLERVEPVKDHVVMRNADGYMTVASNVETLEECLRLQKSWQGDDSPRVRSFTYTVSKLVAIDEK